MNPINKKQCTKCKDWKFYNEFHKDKKSKDGLVGQCKECKIEYSKKHYRANKEEKLKYIKQWNKDNKEHRKQYMNQYRENNEDNIKEYNKQYREENKEYIKQHKLEWYKDNKEHIIIRAKEYSNSQLSFNSKSKLRKEIELYEEVKEYESGNVMCKCAYCGEWFEPYIKQIKSRVDAINGKTEGENRLYCSQSCKNNCPIYLQRLYPKDRKPATSREVQPELRQMVFERDGYTCQKCNTHRDNLEVGIHCHHKEGILWEPLQSADMDMCITLCADCHKEVHGIDGCGYYEMQCK